MKKAILFIYDLVAIYGIFLCGCYTGITIELGKISDILIMLAGSIVITIIIVMLKKTLKVILAEV